MFKRIWLLLPLTALVACGDDDDAGTVFPYRPGETIVVGPPGDVTERKPGSGACIKLANGECVQPEHDCPAGAHADVLLDSQGRLIEAICLPDEADVGLVYVEDGEVVVPDDGAVVILGDQDLAGNLTVEGNRA